MLDDNDDGVGTHNVGLNKQPKTTPPWPDFSFREVTRLSLAARNQLAGIDEAARRAKGLPPKRELLALLVEGAFDTESGIYIPLAPSAKLYRTRPRYSRTVEKVTVPFGFTHFTNALVIPEMYGTDWFDAKNAIRGIDRVTNGGGLVVTMECDPKTLDGMEESLGWFRENGGKPAPISAVDAALARYRDYRGYCAVFSGRHSVHVHFLFDTKHLLNAPWNRSHDERLAALADDASLMKNVHQKHFDAITEMFVTSLRPTEAPDDSLRSVIQMRRTPWAIRQIDKENFLDLAMGTRVVQLVLREKIRTRAAPGTSEYLVSPTFSLSTPIQSLAAKMAGTRTFTSVSSELLCEGRDMCRSKWGEFPRLETISHENREAVFRFSNHAQDQKPSTYVRGSFEKLVLLGGGHSLSVEYHLPYGMSADQFYDHLAISTGLKPVEVPGLVSTAAVQPAPIIDEFMTPFQRLKAKVGQHPEDPMRLIERDFPEPISDRPLNEVQQAYRAKLPTAVRRARAMITTRPLIVQSAEGIGKSTVLSKDILDAHDGAVKDGRSNGFAALSVRSRQHRDEKASEFTDGGLEVIPYRTFKSSYVDACLNLKKKPIIWDEIEDMRPEAIIAQIRGAQPSVFAAMEGARASLWKNAHYFHDTLIVTTHRAAALWQGSMLSRAWNHPDFHADACDDELKRMSDSLFLDRVVFDDPELDEFIEFLPKEVFDFALGQQDRCPNWRNLSRAERLELFKSSSVKSLTGDDAEMGFDRFNELMRLDLTRLDHFKVNFEAFPFGYDNTEEGMYRKTNGHEYWIGPREWLQPACLQMTVITTEKLVCEVADRAFRKGLGMAPRRLDLTNLPGIYPQKIPVLKDDRAVAQKVKELVKEIQDSDEKAVVIVDNVRDFEGVYNFQMAKGRNGLEHNNVYVVPQMLAPAVYAKLNVIGQWLGRPDVIDIYYQDQISQAVGRNRGFRDVGEGTTTVVITSCRLWDLVLKRLQNGAARTLLYLT